MIEHDPHQCGAQQHADGGADLGATRDDLAVAPVAEDRTEQSMVFQPGTQARRAFGRGPGGQQDEFGGVQAGDDDGDQADGESVLRSDCPARSASPGPVHRTGGVQRQVAGGRENERFKVIDGPLAQGSRHAQVGFLQEVFGGAVVVDHPLQRSQQRNPLGNEDMI